MTLFNLQIDLLPTYIHFTLIVTNFSKCCLSFFNLFLKIRLVLWLAFYEFLELLQIFKDLFDSWIQAQIKPKPCYTALNLWCEKCISYCEIVSKAIFSLSLLQHCLKSGSSSIDPIFGPLHSITFIVVTYFLKDSEILVRVYG